ncbi:Mbov_0395 family pilin-like conjugal transfer protein [Metamycoplasma alkalescens]|uniref:Mbov_0395 family pilin-like conjugal transfer protein n=1 Tax=Metamycoplasma alkalescens TaxID=45363 RepID=UPI00058B31C9|nr:hypothetical protein [Metamycoplasma alkalescens]
MISTLQRISSPILFAEATDAASTIKNIAKPLIAQVRTVGLAILGIIVFILAISCLFAALSAQFKLKSGDRDAASQAKKRMKNILIAFIVGFVILAIFGIAIGVIESTIFK